MKNNQSLNEILSEVKKSSASIAEKKVILIKAGLRPRDVELLEFSGYFKVDEEFIPLTFGVEMECYNVVMDNIRHNADRGFSFVWEYYNHNDRRGVYKFTTDGSIDGVDPRECVTPILDNNNEGFKSLENCCRILNAAGAKVNKSCGLHVHVGLQGFPENKVVNIYKNYQRLEWLIDSFMAPSRRLNNNGYCKTLQGIDYSYCTTPDEVYSLMGGRYFKVNPQAWHDHGTIEFRQHQGTTDYQKISMWVNFCCKLVGWSKNNVFDHDVTGVYEIPFLTTEEKEFFQSRIENFA